MRDSPDDLSMSHDDEISITLGDIRDVGCTAKINENTIVEIAGNGDGGLRRNVPRNEKHEEKYLKNKKLI